MIFPFLKYKKQQAPCIAEGPTIKSAKRWHADFQGSKFSIATPYSNEGGYGPDRSPKGSYGIGNHTINYPIKRWKTRGIMNRQYRFWGTRGIGKVSRMTCDAWFSRIRKPKEGSSLFNPRVFEFEVVDYIDDDFINYPEEWYLGQTPNIVRAPIDWKTFDHLPGPTAFFNVDTGTTSAPNYYFVTVLDDYDLLFLGFSLRPNRTGPKNIAPEEWVDQRNMKKLMFDIFETLELKLSPQAEARRLKAIKGLEDVSVKKTMETQSFTYRPQEKKAEQLPKRAG